MGVAGGDPRPGERADTRSIDILHLHARTIERLLDLSGEHDRRIAEMTVAELEAAVAKVFPDARRGLQTG